MFEIGSRYKEYKTNFDAFELRLCLSKRGLGTESITRSIGIFLRLFAIPDKTLFVIADTSHIVYTSKLLRLWGH